MWTTPSLDEILAENTKRELAGFLWARDLSPRPEALRQEAMAGILLNQGSDTAKPPNCAARNNP